MHQFKPNVQTDQVRQYFTSRHGMLLQQGDQRVATCINCHSVHDIQQISDPSSPVYPLNIPDTCGSCHSDAQYMEGYGLPGLTQVADYKSSAHYQALTLQGNLAAPTCVTCHSSHGATPPGVRSVTEVCGTCHSHNRQLFEKSPHQSVFADLGIAGCVQCHGNHAVLRSNEQMLAGPNSVCVECHSEGDEGTRRAQAMAARIRQLDDAIRSARETLDQADRAGMDVSSAASDLTTAHSHLVMARTAIHSLDIEQVNAEVEMGIPVAEEAAQAGRERLAEVQSRRKGVALFSLLVLAVVLTLYLYIRQEEPASTADR
jgi:predicted CXXCH cytochrome family protein